MVYLGAGGLLRRRYIIRFYLRQAGLLRFAAILAAVCLSQVVAAAGSQTRMLRQATTPIVAARFTPTGGVISASKDGTVTMWNRDSDRPLWNISFKRPPRKNDYTQIQITAMDLSLDGRMATVAYLRFGVDRNLIDPKAGDPGKQKDGVWEPHVVLIDTADGTIKQDIQELRKNNTIREVIFSSTGKFVFAATAYLFAVAKNRPPSTTQVLSLDTGHEVRAFNSPDWIERAALSPDGKLFAVAAYQHTGVDASLYQLQFYDPSSGQLLRSSKFETTQSVAIGFSPDSRLLALSRAAKDGMRVDLVPTDGAGKPARTITVGQTAEIRAVAFIGESHQIVLAGGRLPLVDFGDVGEPLYKDKGGAVIIVDERTGKKLKSYEFKSFVTCLAISRDGSTMAAGMYDGQIAITTIP